MTTRKIDEILPFYLKTVLIDLVKGLTFVNESKSHQGVSRVSFKNNTGFQKVN